MRDPNIASALEDKVVGVRRPGSSPLLCGASTQDLDSRQMTTRQRLSKTRWTLPAYVPLWATRRTVARPPVH